MKNGILLSVLWCGLSVIALGQGTATVRSIGVGEVIVMELGNLGDLWVGTSSGALHYSSTGVYEGIYDSGAWVNSIALGTIANNQYAFFGTQTGLAYVETGIEHTVSNSLLPSPDITAIALSPAKQLYAFTQGFGAVVLDSNQNSLGNPPQPFANVNCAYSSTCLGYIAGTPDSGAFYSTDFIHDTVLQTPAIISDSVTAVYIPANCNARLIGTRNGFSFCPTGHPCQNFTAATTHDSLPQDYITTITQDCHGNVWIGMHDSGAVVFSPPSQTFTRVNLPDSLKQVTAIAVNADTCTGISFLGTANGNIAVADSSLSVVQVFAGVQTLQEYPFAINLFPQPALNQVNFVLANEVKNGQICITDINGRDFGCYNLKNTHNFTLDVSNFSDGLYIYKLLADNSTVKTGKLEVLR